MLSDIARVGKMVVPFFTHPAREFGTPRKHSHATSGHLVGKPGSNFNNPTAVGQHVHYKYAAFWGASCHVIAFQVMVPHKNVRYKIAGLGIASCMCLAIGLLSKAKQPSTQFSSRPCRTWTKRGQLQPAKNEACSNCLHCNTWIH